MKRKQHVYCISGETEICCFVHTISNHNIITRPRVHTVQPSNWACMQSACITNTAYVSTVDNKLKIALHKVTALLEYRAVSQLIQTCDIPAYGMSNLHFQPSCVLLHANAVVRPKNN